MREKDTAPRMGGDEFTVLLTDRLSKEAVTAKVKRIMNVMSAPLDAELSQVKTPSCSIGVACYPKDDGDAGTLISHADSHV
jgi:diguanylate cyclase (GGDEF)-like protein